MNSMAFFANQAGQQAQAQGHFLQRNARFIDPWKVAAGRVAQARLEGNWSLTGKAGPAKPLGRVSTRLLEGIRNTTIGKPGARGSVGPAQARESTRYHTPFEYTPQGVDEQLATERQQTQPGERGIQHSPWGNLSETQFLGEHRQQLGGQGELF